MPNIKTKTSNNNGGGFVALAPAVLQHQGNVISADFVGTFPDNYKKKLGSNTKFNFGQAKMGPPPPPQHTPSRSPSPSMSARYSAGPPIAGVSRFHVHGPVRRKTWYSGW